MLLSDYISNLTASIQGTIVALSKMAKKFPKPKGETRTSFMFPSFHQDVVNAVSNKIALTRFYKNNSNRDSNNEYSTYVIGKFKCNNDAYSADG